MKHILKKKIQDCMTTDVVSVTSSTTLAAFRELLIEHDFESFPVLDEKGEYVGTANKLDFLLIFEPSHGPGPFPDLTAAAATTVGEIARYRTYCLSPDDQVSDAVKLMLDKHICMIPVVKKKKLVGIIAVHDLLQETQL